MPKVVEHKVWHRKKKPWFWFILQRFFKVDWNVHCFSFGNVIYAKDKMSPEVLQHELVHLRQHGYSKIRALGVLWRYWRDKEYRLKVELEAYRHQYRWIRKHYGPEVGRQSLWKLAARLADEPYYEKMLTQEKAEKLIESNG